MSTLSVIQPVSEAIRRTSRILFEPFVLSKWLRLGFCSFLMGGLSVSGWGGGRPGGDFGTGGRDIQADVVLSWLQANLAIALTVTSLALVLLVGLALLLTWLSSRGRFMLLDGVVRNRGAIKAPWQEYRREANSLFRFRFVFGLVSLLLLVLILAAGLVVLLPEGLGRPLPIPLGVLSILALALFAWVVMTVLISVLLIDFVVPVMYRDRLPVLAAWRRVIEGLLRPHSGSVALYLVARFLLQALIGVLALMAVLLTCCLASLPYLGSVILLPLSIFEITYPLAFLAQLGPDWQLLPPERQTPASI